MIILYRIYQICIACPILLVLTILTALTTAAGSMIFRTGWWSYYPPRWWSKACCALMFVKVEVKGRDNIARGKSYVFVANHQGAYDIFTVYGYLGHPFKWMMKKSLEKIPLVGFACKCAGHIFVDNSSSSAVLHTFHSAENQLKEGDSLVVFPEGSRTYTGKMNRFKRGAFMLSQEFQLPLVPLTIDGAFDVLPRTGILPKYGKITLTIHKPVAPPVPEENLKDTMELTFKIINSALPARLRADN